MPILEIPVSASGRLRSRHVRVACGMNITNETTEPMTLTSAACGGAYETSTEIPKRVVIADRHRDAMAVIAVALEQGAVPGRIRDEHLDSSFAQRGECPRGRRGLSRHHTLPTCPAMSCQVHPRRATGLSAAGIVAPDGIADMAYGHLALALRCYGGHSLSV